jgi:PhoH-like ATPase
MKKKPSKNHFFILKSERNSVLACYNPVENRLEKVTNGPCTASGRATPSRLRHPRHPQPRNQAHYHPGRGRYGQDAAGPGQCPRTQKALQADLPGPAHRAAEQQDIGYLPGDIKSKLNPYMEPLWDNLKFIQNQFEEGDRDYNKINEMVSKEALNICRWPTSGAAACPTSFSSWTKPRT